MENRTAKLLYRPTEAFEIISVGKSTGYAMIASGELPAIRIGRSVRIPATALRQWVENKVAKECAESTQSANQ